MSTIAAVCSWKVKKEVTYLWLCTHRENHQAGSLPCSHVLPGTWPTLHDSLKTGKYSCFEYGEILLQLSKSKPQILQEGYGTNQPRSETAPEVMILYWKREKWYLSTISEQLMFPWWWLLLYHAFLKTVTRWCAHAYPSTWQEVQWHHRPYLSLDYYTVP